MTRTGRENLARTIRATRTVNRRRLVTETMMAALLILIVFGAATCALYGIASRQAPIIRAGELP